MFQAFQEAPSDAKPTRLQNILIEKGKTTIEYSYKILELVR